MRIVYIGSFPPRYGGVTVKNDTIYNSLAKRIEIKKVNLSLVKKKPFYIFSLLLSLLNRKSRFVVGVAGKKTRKRFAQLFYYLNKKAMNHSVLMVMGGTAADEIASDYNYAKYIRQYKAVYVETEGMRKTLINGNVKNTYVFPNCRTKPVAPIGIHKDQNRLACVFFSNIQLSKGPDIILSAAKELPNVDFYMYGSIEKEYEEEFLCCEKKLSNVKYMGVFRGQSEEIIKEMNKYDILLLPTRWKYEGVPGVLVEGKIAGLAEIVTDICYNSELVKNDKEGMVIPVNSSEKLVYAISCLDTNRTKLNYLKLGSMRSADRFFIEYYIDDLIDQLIK